MAVNKHQTVIQLRYTFTSLGIVHVIHSWYGICHPGLNGYYYNIGCPQWNSAAESTFQQKSWISYSIRSGYAVTHACTCHLLRLLYRGVGYSVVFKNICVCGYSAGNYAHNTTCVGTEQLWAHFTPTWGFATGGQSWLRIRRRNDHQMIAMFLRIYSSQRSQRSLRSETCLKH